MFEVWNDEKWVDGNDVYTFGTLVEAIEFAKHMANCEDETEEIITFWQTSTSDAISLGEWAIQEV